MQCPRCRGRLRLTHDRQRNTSFTYLRCRNGHGRLTTFFDFLREKDFVKPLTAQQLADLPHAEELLSQPREADERPAWQPSPGFSGTARPALS